MSTNTPIWSRTYNKDLALFQELGFKVFQTDNNDKLFVGEYKLLDYNKAKIKIFVRCLPEQIWSFEITTLADEFFMLQTGSGALSDFWDSAFNIAAGILIVTKL